MATIKLDILAQRFMQQIQDPITTDTNGNLQPGNRITTLTEIATYLGNAMNNYIETAWATAKNDVNEFLKMLPELFQKTSITFPQNVTSLDLSNPLNGNHLDIWQILDSNSGTIPIEVWNQIHLADALSGIDPFYTAPLTRPAIIYQKPILYLFPQSLVSASSFSFTLNYLQLPVDPSTGKFLTIDGNIDIPFSIQHIQDIANIATKLERVDDFEEDAG